MKSTFFRALAGFLLLSCLIPLAHAATRVKDLPSRYRHWLTQEVNYIIDSTERKQFLSLTTDTERDAFIKEFWEARNPDPGSSINSYKEEFYQRLNYANEHFGSIGLDNGWRTARGRMYIILGPPKQIMSYPAARNVRPIEIWFYQSPTLALPPYFYILFYKQNDGDPYYSLYSPLQDGPVRLVASLEALNDQKRSLDILRKSLGDEVARISLSLIPGADVSLDDYHPDLTSDVLLSHIAGLPDNPITQAKLQANRLRGHVSMSLFLGRQSRLSYGVFRDGQGRENLSYLLQLAQPDPKTVGTRPDGSFYYDMTLRTAVLTEAGKPVYNQVDQFSGKLTPAQAQVNKTKRFAAEARLPLAPGKYILVATLTNNVDQLATREKATVTVPAIDKNSLALSNLLAYTQPSAVPDPEGNLPFSASHYRFTPLGSQTVSIRDGARLPLVFQLWLGTGKDGKPATERVHLHYAFGSIASTNHAPAEVDEDIDTSNHDAAGNFLTGRTLDTSGLTPGNYQVVVSARRPDDQHTAYASLNLRVVPATEYVEPWTVYGPEPSGGGGIDDLKRGISAQAQGHLGEAQAAYMRSISEGPVDIRAFNRLVDILDQTGQTEQLAALSRQPLMNRMTVNPEALIAIASALNKTGSPAAVVHMLNTQLALQPPNAELYTTLANAYAATGDMAKAREIRTRAAKLK